MTEKNLIRQLKMLREIKPRKDWVVLTRGRLFSQDQAVEAKTHFGFFAPFFRYKLALVPVVSVFIIIGLFGFAQQTVPGNLFFSLKQATESVQVGFSSSVEKPKLQLQFANRRLGDIGKIAEANDVGNLAPAIKAFQSSVSEATKNLAVIEGKVTDSDSSLIKELVAETQKLTENKEKVESVLGAVVGDTQELENTLTRLEKQMAGFLIADLENRTLSEEDQILLAEAKKDFEEGDYSKSLEKIWMLSNQ
jgi:hypothetical protein